VKRLIVVAALGGCGFGSTLTDTPQDAPRPPLVVDGAVDAAAPPRDADLPTLDAQACFGRGPVRVCFTTLPTGPVRLTGAMSPLDTGNDSNCTLRVPQGPNELCVIAGRSVTVAETFVAIGARPLVIVGLEDITIESGGTIDVSSRTGVHRGAGANTGTCTALMGGENDSGGGGGGGGGGGLGTPGGAGGTGDRNRSTRADGEAVGGNGGGVQSISTLRGGCPGSKGGDNPPRAGGAGGDGGGAVYLIAGRTLTIAGNVYASGGGGGATNNNAGVEQGGGGGGAGGMIGLEAPMIQVDGRVVANGGAGGGGGDLSTGGKPGADGSTTLWSDRAIGGETAQGNDGRGADGTAQGKIDRLTAGDALGGGGGGGGGLGFVRIDGTLVGGAQISPAPTSP
jgi:hypothetical protein